MPDHNYTITQLERLQKLREQNAISEEEFTILKNEAFRGQAVGTSPSEANGIGGSSKAIQKRVLIISAVSATVVVVALFFYTISQNTSVVISQKRFEQMMLSTDVAKVVLRPDQNIVEITLREEALQANKYRIELEARRPAWFGKTAPHYKFKIISAENFNEKFREIESQLSDNQRIGYSVKQ